MRRTEVVAVRGGQVDADRARPAEKARRDAVGAAKGSGEGFERAVVGVECDIGNRASRPGELPGGTLQQDATPHRSGVFLDQGLEEAVELRAASVRPAR